MINKIRAQMLRLVYWLEKTMHEHPDYSRNDPEWIELQNECNSMKNDLKREMRKKGDAHD